MTDPVHFRGRRLVPVHSPLTGLVSVEPWMGDAACAGPDTDAELFYPASGGRGMVSTREAKAICAACPVTGDCLAYALRTGDRWGVFGGTSPRDREALRRRARGAA